MKLEKSASSDVFFQFSRKYSLSKTLKFELKPVSETKKHLKNFIDSDTKRAEEYKKLKKIIDEFHKDYIEKILSHKNILDKEDLKDFFNRWRIRNNKENKDLPDKIKEKYNFKSKKKYSNKEVVTVMEKHLRKQIVEKFKNSTLFLKDFFDQADIENLKNFLKSFDKNLHKKFIKKEDQSLLASYLEKPKESKKGFLEEVLFEKEFIKHILPVWLKNSSLKDKEQKIQTVKEFNNWTTYLYGFYENRKNMYSDKEQGTAIAYRIVHENLPKFLGNLQAYQKIKSNHQELQQSFDKMKSDFTAELNCFSLEKIDDLFQLEFFNKCLSQKGIDCYNTLMGGKTIENKKNLKGINQYINLYRQKKQSKNKDIDIKVKYSNKNLPFMELLYKQILSDRESHSFILSVFENKKELLDALEGFWGVLFKEQTYQSYFKDTEEQTNLLNKLQSLLTESWSYYDLDEAYFKSSKLNKLSHNLFGDYSIIRGALNENYEKITTVWADYKKGLNKKDKKEIEKKVKEKLGSFQTELKKALSSYSGTNKAELEVPDKILKSYFESHIIVKKPKKKDQNFYSLQEINDHIELYSKENKELKENLDKLKKQLKDYEGGNIISSWFKYHFKSKQSLDYFLNNKNETKGKTEQNEKPLFSHIESCYQNIQNISSDLDKELKKDEVKEIKIFLDLILHILHLIKPFYLDDSEGADFNNEIKDLYKKIKLVEKLYDKTRNYIVKNKNSCKKVKINFEDSTLLNGWDINKETDNLAVLFKKKENNFWKYYLGVMNKEYSKTSKSLFDYHVKEDDNDKQKNTKKDLKSKILHTSKDENFYKKMNYKQIAKPSQDIQNLIEIEGIVCRKTKQLDELKKKYLPEEVWEIKNKSSYSKISPSFDKQDLIKFIDFYKKMAGRYWKRFNLKFRSSKDYRDFKDFTDHIASQGYQLNFDNKIKSSYIEEKARLGELLLFEIYNKDLSTKSKNRAASKDNLHTLYFKGLFKEENLNNLVLKLNGQAEIFYRKAPFSKKRQVIHAKNQAIKNKNLNNPKETSIFKYDLIKDKRFYEDKFFFHFPISLNFKAGNTKPASFNQEVLKTLNNNKNINVIGIDRGERHLAYYTVINQNRKILEQGSFNKMTYSYKNNEGETIEVEKDYHELLDSKEKERDKSRKEWKKIHNIKELKAGCLSHLVHKIAQLMIKHNAIVVFEDLNFGFKRGRFKFEKQIYQKLEKALVDKLNYLVFKDKPAEEPGGYLNAYQLTALFESFQKMGKQTGFLFYTPAYYTSKVCPLTGFTSLIYPKYENIKKSQEFFKKFDKIYFDQQKDFFVFEYQDSKFRNKDKISFKNWKVCTLQEERYKWDFKNRKFEKINVTQRLKDLFKEHKINYSQAENLKSVIIDKDKKDFFIKLIDCLRVALQLRYINPNSKDEKEQDFILSPAADESGRFFDSRKAKDDEPKNADANGAYHIALKGLMTLQGISKNENEKFDIPKIKNKDWFQFL